MRIALLASLVLLLAATSLHAAFYEWTDEQGVVHFTDKSSKIPAKYRKKAKKMDLSAEPSAVKVNPSAHQAPAAAPPQTAPLAPPQAAPLAAPGTPSQAPAAAAQPQAPAYGGHPEQWWRDQFSTLRAQIQVLQDDIAKKQTKLVELRRKRALYQRAQDRVAINATDGDIAADQEKLAGLTQQMDDLDRQATYAGVPMEWRR